MGHRAQHQPTVVAATLKILLCTPAADLSRTVQRWLVVGLLGYVPGSSSGLPALIFAYALLPLAFKALAGWLLWRWRHTLEL